MTALRELPATAPTACQGWTARHVAAHLAAGSREIADLAEDRVAGRPTRPTRAFEEREGPYRTMPYADVLDEMAVQTRRKLAAYEALAEVTDEPGIDFTGTAITVEELTTHSRSEATLHRWDLVGDDALADELLAAPDALDGDLVITTDPANRLLVLWGRRSAQRTVDIDGPAELAAALPAIIWPHAQPRPPTPHGR